MTVPLCMRKRMFHPMAIATEYTPYTIPVTRAQPNMRQTWKNTFSHAIALRSCLVVSVRVSARGFKYQVDNPQRLCCAADMARPSPDSVTLTT